MDRIMNGFGLDIEDSTIQYFTGIHHSDHDEITRISIFAYNSLATRTRRAQIELIAPGLETNAILTLEASDLTKLCKRWLETKDQL